MEFANVVTITENPSLILLFWIALTILVLYFARRPFHGAIISLSRIIKNAMRLASAGVLAAEKRLVQRNREVLIATGIEHTERQVEREFGRINASVARDLDTYPTLHRKLSDLIIHLDEDYNASAEVPPSLPTWTPIIESLAKIKPPGDSMVAHMLGEINKTLTEQHTSALEVYRASTAARHTILSRMLPCWRRIEDVLGIVGKSIATLNERAAHVDRYMAAYEKIRAQEDATVRKLSSSSLTQFFVAGLVLAIAFGGALINFNLIALPMSEMVGGASYIGPYKTADVAGLVIILIELTMGLFLMESLRITRLFPIIGSMDDRMRHRMIWITLGMLMALAGVESALAFMRDRIAYDMEALRQSLSGVTEAARASHVIPMVGQMVMGFILPFALAFAAIPLESFIASSRTVLGIVGAGVLRLVAFALRLAGTLSYYCGRFVIAVYDFVIFPALWLEETVTGAWRNRQALQTRTPDTEQSGGTADMDHTLDDTLQYKEQPL